MQNVIATMRGPIPWYIPSGSPMWFRWPKTSARRRDETRENASLRSGLDGITFKTLGRRIVNAQWPEWRPFEAVAPQEVASRSLAILGAAVMGLKCYSTEGIELSFVHDQGSWHALRARNAAEKHLRFDCCDAGVVLKTSRLGTRYFAHKARGTCATAPETPEHLMAKAMICETIIGVGWHVEPEQRLPDTEGLCIADVLAKRTPASLRGIAFEIQWSPQTLEVTAQRTARYTSQGIRTVWLMRQHDIPVSKDMPAVRLVHDGSGFSVVLPSERYVQGRSRFGPRTLRETDCWSSPIALARFIEGVLDSRFTFGLPDRVRVTVMIERTPSSCYRCGRDIVWINGVVLHPGERFSGYSAVHLTLLELGDKDTDLSRRIVVALAERTRHISCAAEIKRMYSRTLRKDYLANACRICGSLQGAGHVYWSNDTEFFEEPLEFECDSNEIGLMADGPIADSWSFKPWRS